LHQSGALIHKKERIVKIENIKIGDMVLTADGYEKVTDWFDQGKRQLVKIVTSDGFFECTENHRMPVLKEFNKPANGLKQ